MGVGGSDQSDVSNLEPLKVLVVDDDELNQRMMRVILAREAHQVEVVSSGMEAIEAVKSKNFDIILMDLQMPFMSGVEASQKIRECEDGGRHAYIVALTASYLPEKGRELFEAGIDNYISKPFEIEHLRQMMRHGLDYRRSLYEDRAAAKGNLSSENQGIDFGKGLKRVGGDEKTYKELLEDFVHGLPGKMEVLYQYFNAGDFEGLSRAAHNLKGVSSNLGALQLSEYAGRLEKQAGESYTEPLERLIEETKGISEKFAEHASNFLVYHKS